MFIPSNINYIKRCLKWVKRYLKAAFRKILVEKTVTNFFASFLHPPPLAYSHILYIFNFRKFCKFHVQPPSHVALRERKKHFTTSRDCVHQSRAKGS